MALVALSAAVAFLIFHLATIALYLHRLHGPKRPRSVIGQPHVTLLRPVCGLDPFDEETLHSSFLQDYPRFDIVFCAQSASDPVVPLIERLMAQHPHVRAKVLVGYDQVTANPKLNNVWKGWAAAEADWICMTDSNLLLPPEYLTTIVASWGPATGLVSCPPVGIRPNGFGGDLECAFLNGNQARLQFAADSIGPAYAQGKTLFFNKPLLEHVGGLRALGSHLAEDVSATHVMRGLGREVTLPPLPFAQPIGVRSLRQVWDRQLRWSRVRRDGFPLLFAFEWLNGAAFPTVLLTLGLIALGAEPALGLGYVGLWYLAEAHMVRAAGLPMGWRGALAMPLRDMMIPAIWLATFLRRGFEWRGTSLDAPKAGRASVGAAAIPAE